MQLSTCLKAASQQIQQALKLPTAEANLEANLLLQTSLSVNRAWLISHANDALAANQQAAFQALLVRRLAGEPIAYILGLREFFGLPLKTTPATLIPRPDTETLVEAALEKIPNNAQMNVLDLGTGTGAVALALACQRPQANVTAVDASFEALQVAMENAHHLNLSQVRFIQSDWFSALHSQKFDVIVSNPPYIAEADVHLFQGDLRFEPISALASGVDGLDDIRRIIQDAPDYLNTHGWLMFEHGYDQSEKVAGLMAARGFTQVSHVQDLAGIARVTLGLWAL